MSNIKVPFSSGVTQLTLHGLHQWDYGRKLEIKAAVLADRAVVEVHFAYAGMPEAIVRTCAVTAQTITAAIPDSCLEQSSPIFAWVYCPDETEGFTVLKITMPVTPRTRPAEISTEPPAEYSDQYLDLLAAANALRASTYTRPEIEAALGKYITEVDDLLGGGV
jgi:hypothetical protein